MERPYWRSSAWGGKAPRKKRRSSPLPGELPVAGRSGAAQCRRRLFGSVRRGEPQPGCPKGKCAVKTLPKIKENLEVTQGRPSSNQSYSTQVNVKEMPFLGKNEEDVEGSTVLLKESPVINFESKESLKNTDVTSGTGMTLPTGVSDFLLECLDADSSADRDTVATDTTESFPSPETLRDEECSGASNPDFEDFVKCKNSTLLDCSRAVAIDKILQISNLSPILEPVLEDCKDQCIKRKRPKCNYSSSELSVSTTLAGKKICKITTARERTPALKSGTSCSSPVGAERKPDSQTAEPKRLKSIRKEELSDLLEGNASPCGRLESAPAEASAKSVKVTTEVLPSGQTDDAVLSLSPVCRVSSGEDLSLNTTGPSVNSEETVPGSLSSAKEILPPSPEKRLGVTGKKSAPLSGLRQLVDLAGIADFQLTQKPSAFLKECLKMLLQVLKLGFAVSTDEDSDFSAGVNGSEVCCSREMKQKY